MFSQEEGKESLLFNNEIKKIALQYKSNINFYKSASFFVEKGWDSTLIYAVKVLVAPQNDTLADYAHYFRGCSFIEKKILDEAEKELSLISHDFEFYYIVKLRLGEIALEQNQFKKAILYLKDVLKSTSNLYFKKSVVLKNLGLCFHHLSQFNDAETYLFQSIKLQEESKDTLEIVRTYEAIANLYYEQYQDNLAISYFKKAYRFSEKVKDFETKRNTAFNMAVVEENRKNFKEALVYRKESEQWKDSLNNQNKIYEVAKLEKEFAVKQKQKEVSLLQAENKTKEVERDGLLFSVVTLLILLGVTFYFYKEKKNANKIIVSQKEGLDELNATKDKLFSIVSHDLRSSVNALKASNTKLLDNLEEKNLEALDALLHNNSAIVNGAYNLLDNLLNWALLQTKQSYFEITSIRLFFIVEQMVYNYKPLMLDKSIDFESKVLKKDVVLADQESLRIILRNLLDNAIKFSNPHGIIKVYTQNTDETYCNLIIEDSGLGMSEATRKNLLEESSLLSKKENENIEGTGLGLQLCKSLIKKNNGKLSIESELGKGTKMIVSLPKTTLNG